MHEYTVNDQAAIPDFVIDANDDVSCVNVIRKVTQQFKKSEKFAFRAE